MHLWMLVHECHRFNRHNSRPVEMQFRPNSVEHQPDGTHTLPWAATRIIDCQVGRRKEKRRTNEAVCLTWLHVSFLQYNLSYPMAQNSICSSASLTVDMRTPCSLMATSDRCEFGLVASCDNIYRNLDKTRMNFIEHMRNGICIVSFRRQAVDAKRLPDRILQYTMNEQTCLAECWNDLTGALNCSRRQ